MSFEDILKQWEDKSSKNKNIKKKKSSSTNNTVNMDSFLNMYPPAEGVDVGDIEKETPRQKRRNYRRMKPQEVLDLHGFSIVSASVELEDFIKRCRKRKLVKVLIIHGKGLHSPDGDAVLRIFVRDELRKSPYIGEIGHPSEPEGGAGATWAILKY